MKKLVFLLLITCCLGIDLHSKQWIVFFAKQGVFDGVLRQSFGHAYIGLVWEDPVHKHKVLVDCFGFYPKGGIQTQGLLGFMDGEMREDHTSLREYDFAVEISKNEFLSCLILKKIWAKKKYCLMANNCIDFMKNYCKLISKLKIPKGYFLLASNFLIALKDENQSMECKEDLNRVIEIDEYKKSKIGFIKKQQRVINEKFKKIKFQNHRFFSRDSTEKKMVKGE